MSSSEISHGGIGEKASGLRASQTGPHEGIASREEHAAETHKVRMAQSEVLRGLPNTQHFKP
jgi:hypothetical protein